MPANELPWRTLITSQGPAGRFTREQIRKAVWGALTLKAAAAARRRRVMRLKRSPAHR
jgi:hypothetical protein